MKIRQKMNLAIVIAVAVTLLASTAISVFLNQGKMQEQLQMDAQSSTARLGITLSNPLWRMDLSTARKVIQSELGTNGLVSVDVIGSDKSSLFSYTLNESSGAIAEQSFSGSSYLTNEETIYFEIQGDKFEAGSVRLHFSDSSIQAAMAESLRGGLIQAVLLVVIISLAMWVLTNQIIIGPLQAIRDRVFDIAQGDGDLTQRVKTNGNDEFAELSDGINQFIENVHSIIKQLSDVALLMDQTTQQGNTTTNQLNESVTMLSSEVGHIATSMNEISVTSRDVSLQASELATILGDTSKLADEGTRYISSTADITNELADSVNQSGSRMAELDKHTQEIGSVVTVIESIAEQTNLLALNAAIEAARAGEHGRGFAVVSDEVRSLAQKTQNSISEIVSIVERLQALSKETYGAMSNSLEKVDTSVESVKSAGSSFEDISQAVRQNLSSSDMIATAAEEQAQTLDVIENNIREIKRINEETQSISASNAALNEDIVTSSHKLKALVDKFKI